MATEMDVWAAGCLGLGIGMLTEGIVLRYCILAGMGVIGLYLNFFVK
jgi:hypothetical protein